MLPPVVVVALVEELSRVVSRADLRVQRGSVRYRLVLHQRATRAQIRHALMVRVSDHDCLADLLLGAFITGLVGEKLLIKEVRLELLCARLYVGDGA